MMTSLARFARRASFAAALCLGAGLAGAANSDATEALPGQELSGRTLYQFLLAEIAGARGEVALSAQLYLELARSTRDPRIARRAAEIALYSRNIDVAVAAARLWVEVEPDSDDARRLLASMTEDRAGRLDEIQMQLARALAQNPGRLAQNLMGLNRTLARIEDRQVVNAVIMRLTEPYLDLPEAHFARAQAAIMAQEAMESMASLEKALELRPGWEPAVLLKAQVLQHAGAGEEAVKLLETEAAAHPDNRVLQQAYGRALIGAKRLEDARIVFRGLLETGPEDADLLYVNALLSMQLDEPEAAEPMFERALAAGHPEADAIRLQLGQLADTRREGEKARRWYAQVGDGPRRAEAVIRTAQSLAAENRLADARSLLQSEAGDEAELRRYTLAEVQLLREANDTAEALRVVEKALRAAPDDVNFLYESAMLAERLDRLDTMEERLRRVIELDPEHAHAYNALGYSLADRGLRLEEAQALIEQAIELSPDDPFILDSLGWVRFRRGDAAGALADLERAYDIRPDAEIAAHLGEVLWALGRRDDADRIFNAALARTADNDLLNRTITRLRGR
ncbi:tetratricopeptide repeat protein [Thauera phenolivorans]|uniref:tetratricopeptide repeat protein n=1 Tax=Thauera phenolivorans TaxID=1792543 RepID=UPI00083ABE7C|nr:tetratricopeptide repeat protein [Thauera phenolivorans]